MHGESRAAGRRAALIVGCLAVIALLLVPAGASALRWGQWTEAEEVTETSATVAMYIHPLWPETHWELDVYAPKCITEPERCDEHFQNAAVPQTGTIIQKSPYEIVEIDVTIPGPLYEDPLQPAKLYDIGLATRGDGAEPTGVSLVPHGGADNAYPYPTFETPGAPGPEEQAHEASIAKERSKREKQVKKEEKEVASAEKKLANDKKKSEKLAAITRAYSLLIK